MAFYPSLFKRVTPTVHRYGFFTHSSALWELHYLTVIKSSPRKPEDTSWSADSMRALASCRERAGLSASASAAVSGGGAGRCGGRLREQPVGEERRRNGCGRTASRRQIHLSSFRIFRTSECVSSRLCRSHRSYRSYRSHE